MFVGVEEEEKSTNLSTQDLITDDQTRRRVDSTLVVCISHDCGTARES